MAPFFLVLQFFSLLFHLPKSEAVLVHFGGYWSLLPSILGRFFRKPVYIVLHGTDCASIPELSYGSLRLPLLKWFCGTSYRWATKLLPVSESLAFCDNRFFPMKTGMKNGFRFHFPMLQTPYQVIPNGFDGEFWTCNESIRKAGNKFIAVMSDAQFVLKGGDMIVEMARRFGDYTFSIAGMDKPEGISPPSNLKFLGRLEAEILRSYYQKADYFLQLSIFEGFGCALCEAMLCGCVPIGSEVNEIPTIIGSSGYLIRNRSLDDLETTIMTAANSTVQSLIEKPRRRILEAYLLDLRERLLLEELSKKNENAPVNL